jgi:hypothetical protein
VEQPVELLQYVRRGRCHTPIQHRATDIRTPDHMGFSELCTTPRIGRLGRRIQPGRPPESSPADLPEPTRRARRAANEQVLPPGHQNRARGPGPRVGDTILVWP